MTAAPPPPKPDAMTPDWDAEFRVAEPANPQHGADSDDYLHAVPDDGIDDTEATMPIDPHADDWTENLISDDEGVYVDDVRTVSFKPQTNETNGGYIHTSTANESNGTNGLLDLIKDGDWLDSQRFTRLQFVIEGLIPEGFTIIAGSPKTGKSWFVAGIGLAASAGGRALGHIKVDQRDVLYLALEDGDRRLQSRARQIMEGAPIPAAFHRVLRVAAGQAGELITAWLADIGEDRARRSLVVVDTAQKARPPTTSRAGQYEVDYRFGAAIKAIADAHPGMSIIAVHHTRKAKSDDFVESASGTNGLTGAADTIIVLERERNTETGVLHVTGRDVEENSYQIERQGHGWVLSGDGLEDARAAAEASRLTHNLGDLSTRIVTFIAENPDCSPAQIKDAVDDAAGHVDQYLARMVESGRISRTGRGQYRTVGPKS